VFFASSEQASLKVRERLDELLHKLGLLCHPTKALWETKQFGHHMGINIDSATTGYFFPPAVKLQKISTHARHLSGQATRKSRWLLVRHLKSKVGQAHYLFLVIPAARFFLRELHCVIGD
jgi:hypothetical protein